MRPLIDAFSAADSDEAAVDAVCSALVETPIDEPVVLVGWSNGIRVVTSGDIEVRTDRAEMTMINAASSASWIERRLDSHDVTIEAGSPASDDTELGLGRVRAGGVRIALSGIERSPTAPDVRPRRSDPDPADHRDHHPDGDRADETDLANEPALDLEPDEDSGRLDGPGDTPDDADDASRSSGAPAEPDRTASVRADHLVGRLDPLVEDWMEDSLGVRPVRAPGEGTPSPAGETDESVAHGQLAAESEGTADDFGGDFGDDERTIGSDGRPLDSRPVPSWPGDVPASPDPSDTPAPLPTPASASTSVGVGTSEGDEEPRLDAAERVASDERIPARRCERGHDNDPDAESCRRCGAAIDPQQSVVSVARPVLGRLRLPDGSAWAIRDTLIVGRHPGAIAAGEGTPVVVDDPSVSRRHLTIRADGWSIVARDVGSTGGSARIAPGSEPLRMQAHVDYVVEPGSSLLLGGPTRLEIEVDEESS